MITLFSAMIFALSTFAQLWAPTEDFSSKKNSQTVTKLDDGRVIQIGGDRGFNAYSRAVEIYNPSTNIWTTVDSLPYSLRYHSAFLMDGNKVLVMGGTSDGASSNGVLEYNVDTDSWTSKTAMPEALENLSAQKLSNGSIFVCGGWVYETADVNQDAYIYDPIADAWSDIEDMPVGLVNSVCELIREDEILVAGGVKSDFSTSAKSYVYAVSSGTWSEESPLPFAISGGMASVQLEDGNVLAAGGFDFGSFTYRDKVLLFDTELGEWSEVASLNGGMSSMTLVHFPDGTSLLAGGNDGNKSTSFKDYSITTFNGISSVFSRSPSTDAFIVEAETYQLTPIENLPRPTTGAMSVLLDNKDVLMSGGSGIDMASDTYNNGIVYNNPISVGINTMENAIVNVFPNPAHSAFVEVNTQGGNASEIIIVSLTGAEVLRQSITAFSTQINIGQIPTGVYIVKTDLKDTFVQKLIVK